MHKLAQQRLIISLSAKLNKYRIRIFASTEIPSYFSAASATSRDAVHPIKRLTARLSGRSSTARRDLIILSNEEFVSGHGKERRKLLQTNLHRLQP